MSSVTSPSVLRSTAIALIRDIPGEDYSYTGGRDLILESTF